MRLILISAVLAAAFAVPASATPITYPQCIDMLKAMLGNQQAISDAMANQDNSIAQTVNDGVAALANQDKSISQALNDGVIALAAADKANMKAQTDIDAEFKAYTAALGDACQAIR